MFQIGTKKPYQPVTPDEREALDEIDQFCAANKLTKDKIAQLIGFSSWNSLKVANTRQRRVFALAEIFRALNRCVITNKAA